MTIHDHCNENETGPSLSDREVVETWLAVGEAAEAMWAHVDGTESQALDSDDATPQTDWSEVYGVDGLDYDPWPSGPECPRCLNTREFCYCDQEEAEMVPTCSICDGAGHGYPGAGPCPLESVDYFGEPEWAL